MESLTLNVGRHLFHLSFLLPCYERIVGCHPIGGTGLGRESEIVWNPRHQDGKTNGNQLCRFDGNVFRGIYY